MKRLLLILLLFASSLVSFAQVHVRGYYRKNGTYVEPHVRTRPNHTITDNYSYPGNYNPNTGRITGGSVRTRSSVTSAPTPDSDDSPVTTTYSEPSPVAKDKATWATTSTTASSQQLYAQAEPNAALKAAPSYMANSSYAIPKGAVVKVTKHDEYYYRAEANGYSGYLCKCQVRRTYTNL
ncbi:hypothetical protein ACFSUS_05935 [Spirosoma soli]|uniref:SH3 domain-containing protein n=1 Tax=Spirosoma soli TaxID=1770529 RepID=A0ABW5LZE2_9BACT